MDVSELNIMNNQKEAFLKMLEGYSYKKGSLTDYRRVLNKLIEYMCKHEVQAYSAEIGEGFINDTIITNNKGSTRISFSKTVVRRFNEFLSGKEYKFREKNETIIVLPADYFTLLNDYLENCKLKGNKPKTIYLKKKYCNSFLMNLIELGCNKLNESNVSIIGKAIIMDERTNSWSVIRQFLTYLYTINIITCDYSAIVPQCKYKITIPDTYTEIEINRFEAAIDRETLIGKRDYAALLLATRLGMRTGDITKLTFQEIDFTDDKISFTQEKTDEFQQLPLLPIIKEALEDYINNARPDSDAPFVFLRTIAPHIPITTATLKRRTTKYFKIAEINILGKRHGLHSLRSSLASSMVNDNISYEVVRNVLGHADPNTIKHYARLDIEKLREYAIDAPEPTGVFKDFLNGKKVL